MVLNDKSGIDGENFAVGVELNTVASPHVTLACQVCDKLILEPTDRNECRRVIGDKVLSVDGALEDTAILVDVVFWERDDAYPLAAIQILIPDI
jgi:hypothetical protein